MSDAIVEIMVWIEQRCELLEGCEQAGQEIM
jgi:hypothetical protein